MSQEFQSACRRRRLGQGLTRHFIGRRGGDLRDKNAGHGHPCLLHFYGRAGREFANHWRGGMEASLDR